MPPGEERSKLAKIESRGKAIGGIGANLYRAKKEKPPRRQTSSKRGNPGKRGGGEKEKGENFMASLPHPLQKKRNGKVGGLPAEEG